MDGRLEYKHFYRRNLPHLVRSERPLFLTFSTFDRLILTPGSRTITLRHILHEHRKKILVDVAVVMPDHVHLVMHLLSDERGLFPSLAAIMKGIKGVSARRINEHLGCTGRVWQDESFDHVLRQGERSRAKYEYICDNPVRAGLTRCADDYPWIWRSWIEGKAAM